VRGAGILCDFLQLLCSARDEDQVRACLDDSASKDGHRVVMGDDDACSVGTFANNMAVA
jgi:hypothetical protein